MGRQSGDPTMVGSSSIALLQQRFKELEKIKERRKGRELMKRFSGPVRFEEHNTPFASEQTHCNYQNQARVISSVSTNVHEDCSLSLGLNSQSKQVEFWRIKKMPQANLWPKNTSITGSGTSSKRFDNFDVDTSLHL